MDPQPSSSPRRRRTRAAAQKRRRRRALRRIAGVTLALCVVAGGTTYVLSRPKADAAPSAQSAVPATSAAPSAPASAVAPSSAPEAVSTAASPAASPAVSTAASAAASEAASAQPAANALGLTAAEAQAMLADPLMVLVNHTNKMPDDYTFETAECGSATAINKKLQTVACDAFLQMQAAAAADGVTVWMQSGYRSVSYQSDLYTRKTNYYLNQGFDEATAKEKAAAVVNPPGYSEHNCGLAADLNSPEHTDLDEGFEGTTAFTWLCAHAGEYGFILRYPKGAEDKTEITYEPWHWRYVGVENAAKINASGLCFEEYCAALQQIAANG